MMNDEKREALRKDFADVIKSGAEGFLADSPGVEALTDAEMEALGLPLPPADMLARVKRACAPERPRRALRRAVVAAAALAAAVGAAFSVHAVRTNIWNTVVRSGRYAVSITYDNAVSEAELTEEEAYLNAEKELNMKLSRPMYMPVGYKLSEMYKSKGVVEAVYKNDSGGRVEVRQQLAKEGNAGVTFSVDAKDYETKTITLNNSEVTFVSFVRDGSDEKWASAIWFDEGMCYTVDSNAGDGETEKIVRNMK